MQTFICNKVSKTDSYSQARCAEYVKARHKMIYEGFDWKAAQTLVPKTISGAVTTVSIPELHHVMAVRLDGKKLDRLSPSVIFDREVTETDEYATGGTPKFYEEFWDLSGQTRSIRFFPPLANDSNNHSLILLGKTPYNDAWTQPAIPATENALIAFATADMWEYLHEVGKAQSKLQEGVQILQQAQGQDASASLPRITRRQTAEGNTLKDMVATVCMITGDFSPDAQNIAAEFIRRSYRQIWDSANWPETMVTDTVTISGGRGIVSHLIDKIIAVRANLSMNTMDTSYSMLPYEDSAVVLGLMPEAFNQAGTPVGYNLLLPVGLPLQPPNAMQLKFQFAGSETQTVTLRGESGGVDVNESLKVSNTSMTSVNSYDVFYTISKPMSASALTIRDVSDNILMVMQPYECSRKYSQIQVLPDFDTTMYPDQTLYVLGKRILPQLLEGGDVPVLTGIENLLIGTAVAQVFGMMGKLEQAGAYKTEAGSAMQALVSRVTQQQSYHPRILPYAEPSAMSNRLIA